MQFIYGLLTAVAFAIALFAFYLIGVRHGKKKSPELTDDEKERRKEIERFNKHFKELFNYSETKALQRKQVK